MKRFLRHRWIYVLLPAVVLGASFWLNGWLILKVLDYKGRLLLAREFPDQIPLNVPRDARQLVWLAGDSRIAAWPLSDTVFRRFVNRGVSGFTARETLDRFQADLAAGSRPDVIVIQAGINDVLSAGYNRPSRLPGAASDALPGRPGPQQIMERCAADLKTMVQTAANAGGHVILLTVFPPGPLDFRDRFFWSAELDDCVAGLNESLRRLACPSVSVLDAATLLSDSGRTKKEHSLDTLHLNSRGYELLTGALETALSTTVPPKSPAP